MKNSNILTKKNIQSSAEEAEFLKKKQLQVKVREY